MLAFPLKIGDELDEHPWQENHVGAKTTQSDLVRDAALFAARAYSPCVADRTPRTRAGATGGLDIYIPVLLEI